MMLYPQHLRFMSMHEGGLKNEQDPCWESWKYLGCVRDGYRGWRGRGLWIWGNYCLSKVAQEPLEVWLCCLSCRLPAMQLRLPTEQDFFSKAPPAAGAGSV